MTPPTLRTSDPRLLNAAKVAYKSSMGWGQPKSRGSNNKRNMPKAGPNHTEPSLPEGAGNQVGIQRGGNSQHFQSLITTCTTEKRNGGNAQHGGQQVNNLSGARGEGHAQRSHSQVASRGNNQQSRSQSGSRGNTQQGHSQSSGRGNDQQGCLHSAPDPKSTGNDEKSRSQSAGKPSTPEAKSSRNVQQDNSQSNDNQSMPNRYTKSFSPHTSEDHNKVLHPTSSNSSLIEQKHYTNTSLDTFFPSNAKQGSTRKRKKQSRKSLWSKGVISTKYRKQCTHSSSTSGLTQTQHSTIECQGVKRKLSSQHHSKKEDTLMEPLAKNVKMTRSKFSMKEFTFKMGAKNSLSGKEQERLLSKRVHCKIPNHPKRSISAPPQQSPRSEGRNEVDGFSISDRSIEMLDISSNHVSQDVESNYLSSDDEFSDYASSYSGESSDTYYRLGERSVNFETPSSRGSISDNVDYSYSRGCRGLQEDGAGTSSIHASMLENSGSNLEFNTLENDDSSLSESDIACPIFVRHKLLDNVSDDTPRSDRVIKFNLKGSSESDDNSEHNSQNGMCLKESPFSGHWSRFERCGSIEKEVTGQKESSFSRAQRRFERSGSVESDVTGRREHVSRRDQQDSHRKLVTQDTGSGVLLTNQHDSDCKPVNKGTLSRSIRTRSHAVTDIIRTRGKSQSLPRHLVESADHLLSQQLLSHTRKDRTPKKQRSPPKSCRSSKQLPLQRSSSLGRVVSPTSISKLGVKDSVALSDSKSSSSNEVSFQNQRSYNSNPKSETNLFPKRMQTRSHSLSTNLIGTGIRTRSQSLLNLNARNINSLQLSNQSKGPTPKKQTSKKSVTRQPESNMQRSKSLSTLNNSAVRQLDSDYCSYSRTLDSMQNSSSNHIRIACKVPCRKAAARESVGTRSRSVSELIETRSRSQSLSRLVNNTTLNVPSRQPPSQCKLGTPTKLSPRKLEMQSQPKLRRCISLSTIESSSVRGIIDESDLDNLSDASSATSNRVASLKAHALTARKFRPPSQHEIEQKEILQKLQWFGSFSFSKYR